MASGVKTIIIANVLLLLSMVAFGSSFVASKIALQYYDPIYVAAGRLFAGSIVFIFFIKELSKVSLTRKDLLVLFLVGLFEPFLCFIFEGYALEYTSASQAGVITALLPLMVAVGAWFALSEKMNKVQMSGFMIAILGVISLTMMAKTTETAPNPFLGNILEILAMACAAISVINIKKLSQKLSSWAITAFQVLISSVLFVPLLALTPSTYCLPFCSEAIGPILYLGIVVNIVAYGFYNYGVSKISASQATIYVSLVPVFAMFFAYLILKESMSLQSIVASFFVLGGVVISQMDFKDLSLEASINIDT